jgi:CheY-like chemotaxis protein
MPCILLVDDELQNLNAMKRELSDRDPTWQVITAGNEVEAAAVTCPTSSDHG